MSDPAAEAACKAYFDQHPDRTALTAMHRALAAAYEAERKRLMDDMMERGDTLYEDVAVWLRDRVTALREPLRGEP